MLLLLFCNLYRAEYLSGYAAEKPAVGVNAAWADAKGRIESEMRNLARRDILSHADEAQVTAMDTDHSNTKYKLTLLPMYLSSFTYKDKAYHVLVNGQNGKCSGQSPVSPWRVMVAILLAIALALGIGYVAGAFDESTYDDTIEHVTRTIGRPLGDTEVSVRSLDGSRECKRDGTETGEICLRGSFMMLCYYKLGLDNQAIDADGWLHTGDLGYLDEEGYVHLSGRSKEIIIRGGENIIPNEIATAISEHDGIGDVKVLGVPDDFFGETVAAALLLKDGYTFDEAEMREFLRSRLAKYKIPAYFEVYDSFPYLASGKVDGISLKKDFVQRIEEKEEQTAGGIS